MNIQTPTTNPLARIIILAAGHGKRMNSDIPKAMTPLHGMPFIQRILNTIASSNIDPHPIVVTGHKGDMVRQYLGDAYEYVHQDKQLGTGHAVMCTKDQAQHADTVIVLYTDHPLISRQTLKKILATHHSESAILTLATTIVPDFQEWRSGLKSFGRLVRNENGEIEGIIEVKDATDEQKLIKELNPAYMCFNSAWLWQHLQSLKNDNSQGEYYLTDLVRIARTGKHRIASLQIDPWEALGINTKEDLMVIENILNYGVNNHN